MENELRHYGILGMKWGVRRYQNADGSLTAAGKKRYGSDDDGDSNSKSSDSKSSSGPASKRKEQIDRYFENSVKAGKDKPNISPAEKIAKNVQSVGNDSSKVINAATRIKNRSNPAQKIDLSNMSDQELRNIINRIELEEKYISKTSPQKVSKGKEYADDILDIVAGVAGVTGSIVGTIALIKALKTAT